MLNLRVSSFTFPFPSTGKAYPKKTLQRERDANERHVSIPFKRESISKVYLRRFICYDHYTVSIPFKRESISKDKNIVLDVAGGLMFQFPSNGKAYPKDDADLNIHGVLRFNSLQTGKHIQSGFVAPPIREKSEFPFPSNGKAYPKQIFGIMSSAGSM